ncbi:uncharacterized protein LOC135497993 isoform X2 [Lineus longissimus]|uniref:uncharacterized protein LOC135497993 isoform X2 n=1 Tax=Lineus longissimus TaxID=88925 RepID=UPI00315CF6F1
MCRFGCTTTNTTYMCKWCGTRYCRECLHGEFTGEMKEENWCRVCNQRCQGKKVEYVEGYVPKEDNKGKKGRGSAKGRAGAKKGKKGKKGKKSGKKKKKR